MNVPINGMLQTFSATSTANSKKFATAAVSFDVLVQLYRLGQIEAYDDNAPKRPKQPRDQRERYRERHVSSEQHGISGHPPPIFQYGSSENSGKWYCWNIRQIYVFYLFLSLH